MLVNGKMNYNELEQIIYHLRTEVVNTFLKNIYHYEGRWLFKFNKVSFVFEPGIGIWPCSFNEREINIHSVVTKIRKEIKDHKVVSIDIINNDRTVVLETYNHKIVLELYAKGNLILLDKNNIIIVLTRIYPECSHGKEYEIKKYNDFTNFESKKYYLKNGNEICQIEDDMTEEFYENIIDALRALWNIKINEKEKIKLKKEKKKNSKKSPLDGINNQISKFNSKIDNKLKQLEKLEEYDELNNFDFNTIGKLHQERKAIVKKLNSAQEIKNLKISQSKKDEKKLIKKENQKIEKIILSSSSWYQNYHWWYTKNGFLVVGGRCATDNEKLVKSYMNDNDIYFHTDEPGSGSFIMFTNGIKDFIEKKEYLIDIDETAEGVLAFSNQWNTSCPTGNVFYVKGSQVTKSAPSGEYIGKGSFMIYGKKEFVKVTGTTLGYGIYKDKDKSMLMLAPYRIINRLGGSSVRLKPRNDIKKMKGKIITSILKKKLNIDINDTVYIFNKPCNVI